MSCSSALSSVLGSRSSSQGNLAAAAATATSSNDSYLACLVGASDGASPAQRSRAFEFFGSEETAGTCDVLLYALSVREGNELKGAQEVISKEMGDEAKHLMDWLKAGSWRSEPEKAEGGVRHYREFGLMLATIADPSGAPAYYRDIARTYFFAGERPYLRPSGVDRK